jgi:LPS sulfotransferase NodH
MQQNFVIFGRMRCGSSLLCSLLDSHPDVRCELELLHRERYRGGLAGTEAHLRSQLFDLPGPPIRGCKILYHQTFGIRTSAKLVALLRQLDCKFIHLIRWNQLDSFVSHMLAKRSRIWNAFRSKHVNRHFVQERPGIHEEYNQPIYIDPIEYMAYKEKTRVWARRIGELCPDALRVHYEDLYERMPMVLEFLGAKAAPLTADTIKLRTRPKSELILNYDELKTLI